MSKLPFSDQLRGAIVAELKTRGMSRYRFARQLGVGESFLSDLVLGKCWIGEEMVNRVAGALDLRVVAAKNKRRK